MKSNELDELDYISFKIFEYIKSRILTDGRSPSIGEIQRQLGYPKSTVNNHLRTLEKAQLIYCEPYTHCGIRLLRDPRQGIPLIGRIAAGEPIENFAEHDEMIDMGRDLQGEDMFALQVKGWSMRDDLISDGDYIAIRRQHSYAANDIIVAVNLPLNAATLKRYVQGKGHVHLVPSNSDVDPIIITNQEWENEWEVQGKVIRVLRRYIDNQPKKWRI